VHQHACPLPCFAGARVEGPEHLNNHDNPASYCYAHAYLCGSGFYDICAVAGAVHPNLDRRFAELPVVACGHILRALRLEDVFGTWADR